MFFAIMAELE
jgi:putative toxin-antitoxin system antitoxin component (TIGR02293 family)